MTALGIDARSAIGWTTARGVAPTGPLTERPLSGGVSSSVWAVEGSTAGVVVKRALAELLVDTDWRADPRRSLTEARALEVMRAITPARVPRVLDIDPGSSTIVMERAPLEARSWRDMLLEAPSDPAVGAALGATIAAWHRATWLPWAGAADFVVGEAFEQLRLEPFHGAVARRLPDVADAVSALADELRRTQRCLVHGDVSPKNVLVGPGCLWVIDPEVAHLGDPVFDVAFMGAHLVLAALARPSFAASIGQTWGAFLTRYLADAPSAAVEQRLDAHLGCILLARTDGVSREPGLDTQAVERARELGRVLVGHPGGPARAIWNQVCDVLR